MLPTPSNAGAAPGRRIVTSCTGRRGAALAGPQRERRWGEKAMAAIRRSSTSLWPSYRAPDLVERNRLVPVFFPRGGKKGCAKVFRAATGRAPRDQQGLKCSNQMVPWGQSPPGQEAATGSDPGYEQPGGNLQRSARVSMLRHAFGCVRRDSGDAPPMILRWPLACRSCWASPCSAPPATYVCPGPGCVEQKVAVL